MYGYILGEKILKEDVHSGHRDRLRNKFLIHGIDIFELNSRIESSLHDNHDTFFLS